MTSEEMDEKSLEEQPYRELNRDGRGYRSNPCGIEGCQVKHGLYPQTEHLLLEASEEKFDEIAKAFQSITGLTLSRR